MSQNTRKTRSGSTNTAVEIPTSGTMAEKLSKGGSTTPKITTPRKMPERSIDLEGQLAEILAKINDLAERLDGVEKSGTDNLIQGAQLAKDMADLTAKVTKFTESHVQLAKQVDYLTERVGEQQDTIAKLRATIHEFEVEKRKKNIIIYGLEEKQIDNV